MSDSAHDSFLDAELERYYEDEEEDILEDDWMIDKFIEDQINRESFDE